MRVYVKPEAQRYLIRSNRTQADLARELGTSPSFVSQLLRQQKPVGALTRRRLAALLALGFDDIFVIRGQQRQMQRVE